MTDWQVFPALDAATEAALRDSIQRFGVLVPVFHDQHGRTLDGHHRERIAVALGVPVTVIVRPVADDDEAREIARTLNADRRQMTPEQRSAVVVALRSEGHSLRAIAGAVGVSVGTVQTDVARVQVHTPVPTKGRDGKTYPASRPRREPVEREAPDPPPYAGETPEVAEARRAFEASVEAAGGASTDEGQRLLESRREMKREVAPIDDDAVAWITLVASMDAIEAMSLRDAPLIAATVPLRRRAATARRLRVLGTYLGSIAWSLERMGEPS